MQGPAHLHGWGLMTADLYDIGKPAVQLFSHALNIFVSEHAHASVGVIREAQFVFLDAKVTQRLTVLIDPCHHLQPRQSSPMPVSHQVPWPSLMHKGHVHHLEQQQHVRAEAVRLSKCKGRPVLRSFKAVDMV